MRGLNRRVHWVSLFLAAALVLAGPGCGSPRPAGDPGRASPAPEAPAADRQDSPVVQGRWVQVARVVDGDTLELSGGEKVRLIGVNTPETVKPDSPPQPYGKEASEFTKKNLEGKRVFLELDVQQRDRYGRILGYVYLRPPRNREDIERDMFNAVLLREGYAQVMTVPPNVKYADLFVRLQREAKAARRGLWALGIYKDEVQSTGDVFLQR